MFSLVIWNGIDSLPSYLLGPKTNYPWVIPLLIREWSVEIVWRFPLGLFFFVPSHPPIFVLKRLTFSIVKLLTPLSPLYLPRSHAKSSSACTQGTENFPENMKVTFLVKISLLDRRANFNKSIWILALKILILLAQFWERVEMWK